MSAPFDAVLSVHVNPMTCGTAKFSQQLAARLAVPFLPVSCASQCAHPLLSVRFGELQAESGLTGLLGHPSLSVLWHDRYPEQSALNAIARQVWYADELGAPSTLRVAQPLRAERHVLTFGMAHKHQAPLFQRLKDLLETGGRPYTVGVSCAVHEGSPWADTLAASDAALRAIFGSHLRHYGFLADDGLGRAMLDASMVALFYDPAVRRNNTTLWGALAQGALVITNLDADSPPELVHGVSVYDIAQLATWPDQAAQHRAMRYAARQLVEGRYGWAHLLAQLGAEVVA